MKCKNCGREIELKQSFFGFFKVWQHIKSGLAICRTYATPTESEATQ